MKKIILSTAALFIGLTAFGQQRPNPALDSLKAIKDPIALQQKLKSLGTGAEKDLILLMQYYQGNEKSADSVAKVAQKKFPKGQVALWMRSDELYTAKDPATQEQGYLKLSKDYPAEDFNYLIFQISEGYAKAKNTAKALQYLELMKGKIRAVAMSNIPGTIMEYDADAVEKVVKKEMAATKEDKETQLILLNIYSQIMEKKGNYQEAFTAMQQYRAETSRKSPELDTHYYYLMSKSGDFKTAFPELEKAAGDRMVGDKVKKELETAYSKLNPGKDAAAYMAGLKSRFDDKYKNELLGQMVKEASPDFVVTDLNGKAVSLADFKGKTIVLDFWATWCGPCKRALPAMQMTMDKYAADPDVKFLFIHTWEKTADPTADAISYLKSNNYHLPLYMDLKDKTTGKNKAVSAFGVTGIPAKFVIDGNGNIRFKMSGFGGSDEAAVTELSTMITLARKSV